MQNARKANQRRGQRKRTNVNNKSQRPKGPNSQRQPSRSGNSSRTANTRHEARPLVAKVFQPTQPSSSMRFGGSDFLGTYPVETGISAGDLISWELVLPNKLATLSRVSALYQRIKYQKLTISVNAGAGTTTGGQFGAYFLTDPTDKPHSTGNNASLIASNRGKVLSYFANDVIHVNTAQREYYTNEVSNLRFACPGSIVLVAVQPPTTNCTVSIWVNYSVLLAGPTLETEPLGDIWINGTILLKAGEGYISRVIDSDNHTTRFDIGVHTGGPLVHNRIYKLPDTFTQFAWEDGENDSINVVFLRAELRANGSQWVFYLQNWDNVAINALVDGTVHDGLLKLTPIYGDVRDGFRREPLN